MKACPWLASTSSTTRRGPTLDKGCQSHFPASVGKLLSFFHMGSCDHQRSLLTAVPGCPCAGSPPLSPNSGQGARYAAGAGAVAGAAAGFAAGRPKVEPEGHQIAVSSPAMVSHDAMSPPAAVQTPWGGCLMLSLSMDHEFTFTLVVLRVRMLQGLMVICRVRTNLLYRIDASFLVGQRNGITPATCPDPVTQP